MTNLSDANLDMEILAEVEAVKGQLAAIMKSPAPNDPIQDFTFPSPPLIAQWQDRLEKVTRDTLVEEVAMLVSEIHLPVLDRDDARYDHLKIYHQLSALQEALRSIASIAMTLGYPSAANVVAKTADIEPELSKILQLLNGLRQQTEKIERQTAAKISDGIAVAIGPVSVTLGSIKQSAALALKKIRLDSYETNVGALVSDLQRIASASNRLVEHLQTLARHIPQWMRAALKGVVQTGREIAERGIELMRTVRRNKQKSRDERHEYGEIREDNRELDQQTLSDREAKKAGAALRTAREKQKISVREAAQHLKIRSEHVHAIEEGQFQVLPGRTYAIGWVRAYAWYLGIAAEELLNSVRRATL